MECVFCCFRVRFVGGESVFGVFWSRRCCGVEVLRVDEMGLGIVGVDVSFFCVGGEDL